MAGDVYVVYVNYPRGILPKSSFVGPKLCLLQNRY